MSDKWHYLFKVIIIGDSGVGKTSILSRFAGEDVTKSHISTIGKAFSSYVFCNLILLALIVLFIRWSIIHSKDI